MRPVIRIVEGGLLGLLLGLTLSCPGAETGKGSTHPLPSLKVDPFAGLEPMAESAAQAGSFRPGPRPPPTTTREESLRFPVAQAEAMARTRAASKPAGPLQVLRAQPKGANALVGAVTVDFNQPMVPVASLAALAQQQVPLEITPQVRGRFRWLGTQTVAFEPEGRMPFATEYRARLRAGTRSAIGGVLDREVRFSFSTPRPDLVAALPHYLGDQVHPATAVALLFNQRVSSTSLLALFRMNRLTGKDLEVVPRASWAKLRDIGAEVVTWDPERTVVLQPRRPLEPATRHEISVPPGLEGEGPLRSQRGHHHVFSTYGPLRVRRVRCGDEEHCSPAAGFSVRFSNPLLTADAGKLVQIAPRPPGFRVEPEGAYLSLRGDFEPQTSYRITIRKGFADIHQQQLSTEVTSTVRTGNLTPELRFPVQGLAALELRGKREIPLEVHNVAAARLRLVAVEPAQVLKLVGLASASLDDEGGKDPLKGIKGLKVTRTLRTGIKPNGKGKLGLLTDEALGPRGAGPLFVELRSDELRRQDRWADPFRCILVQVTDIGVMARYDSDQIVALITRLEAGTPLAGARVELRDAKGAVVWSGQSDGKGLVRAPGRRALQRDAPFVLWAAAGADRAFVVIGPSGDDGSHLATYGPHDSIPPREQLAMHLFTDRSPYRPGETVHLKGVLRTRSTLPGGGIRAIAPEARAVELQVRSSEGRLIREEKAIKLGDGGAFSLDVVIPEGSDLGAYRVQARPTAGPLTTWATGSFQVEEYRAPELSVKVEASGEPYFFKDRLRAQVGAEYLFGAPMTGAPCGWTLSRQAATFAPPGNDGFSFGEPSPSRFGWRVERGRRRHREGWRMGYTLVQSAEEGEVVDQGAGLLDARGRLRVQAPLLADPREKRIGPASFTLEAQVFDQNRQMVAGRQAIVVHPASRYVGLRADRTVVRAGETIKVSAVLVGLDGKRLSGEKLSVEAVRVETKVKTAFEEGRWIYKYEDREVASGSCALTTAADPTDCSLGLKEPGAYRLRAAGADEKGRRTRTAITVYAHGPGHVPWNLQNQSQIELVPDKKEYRPGEVARILVKSPLRRATGLLAIQRRGLDRVEPIGLEGNARVIEVPIRSYHLPEVHVGVSLARGRLDEGLGQAAQDLGRPTLAHGSVRLPVTLSEKTVTVLVKPLRETVGPSEKLEVQLSATDAAGKPVRGELAVMVVDEGVLSLLQFPTPDPLELFFPAGEAGAPLVDLRNALLGKEEGLRAEKSRRHLRTARGTIGLGVLGTIGRGGDGAGYGRGVGRLGDVTSGERASARRRGRVLSLEALAVEGRDEDRPLGGEAALEIRSRTSFATTAYYNPSVLTDERGQARVTVAMPDNLTTYRIMAVALDRRAADRFGKGEAQVKVRKPLLLRPSLPRFLSTGDRFEAAVMIHNETGQPGDVDVLCRGRGVKPAGEPRVRVQIPSGGAREVRFKLLQDGPGPARLQFAAVLGRQVDAVERELPVLLPSTTEAFASYGMVEGSVTQPVVPPTDALPDHGGLSVSMASTALGGLEDAVSYLIDYPHECSEQTASRLLPIFSLRSILEGFRIARARDLAAQKSLAATGLRKLLAWQRHDGGWSMWEGSRISWAYLTAYVTFALLRAREAGEAVPEASLRRARQFLKIRLDHPRRELGEQHAHVEQVTSAWILSELGQHERGHLARLFGLRRKLPLFARTFLMAALFRADGLSPSVKELLRELENTVVQTAAAAHFAEARTESLRLLMHSDDRTDAIALLALLEVAPDHPLLSKLARGLLDARVRGRWSTTQSNAFALVALARYYKQVEHQVPDFVSRVWYGEGLMGEGAFKGREMKIVQQRIPMAALRQLGEKSLVLARQGAGNLYYRIGLSYAPKDLRLPPEEQGFAVSRLYEPILDRATGKADARSVRRRADGTWEIRAGATVRVRLVLVVPDQRYFVAIADPLPAGLEAVNLSFATSARALAGQLDNRTYDTWSHYSLFAFDHREMRDDRVVLFADRLPAGVYEHTYLARATSFGRFVVAPVKAEEMYHPETFGRSETTFVEVR